MIVLIAPLLMLTLTSCMSRKPLIKIDPCDTPKLEHSYMGKPTWQDYYNWALREKAALDACNIRIRAAQALY